MPTGKQSRATTTRDGWQILPSPLACSKPLLLPSSPLLVDPDDLRERYLALIRDHLAFVKQQCEEGDIEYIRFVTNEPVEQVALKFLRARQLLIVG